MMISSKVFIADGDNARFLSDFIIVSEQFVRVYAYLYDGTISSDVLQDGTTDPANWSYPDNLWVRGFSAANTTEDRIPADQWDLVTNSVLLYDTPPAFTTVWIEVVTSPEEFSTELIDSAYVVLSDVRAYVAATRIPNMIEITQAAYDALTVKAASTLYVIVG